jgi:hypothetical protein
LARLGMFLSSYAPLFAILAVRFTRPELVIGCASLSLIGIAAAVWIIATERAKGAAAFTVANVEDKGAEVAGYIATYLLPFVTVAEPSNADVVGYLIFLAVAAVVYVQSDMLQINPIFYVLGRRVVRITTTTEWQAYLITRRRPLKNETIQATTLATGVLVRAGGT